MSDYEWFFDNDESFTKMHFVIDDFETFVSSVKGLKLFTMATAESVRTRAIEDKLDIEEKLGLLFKSSNLMDEGYILKYLK